jgi:hypothetical protein
MGRLQGRGDRKGMGGTDRGGRIAPTYAIAHEGIGPGGTHTRPRCLQPGGTVPGSKVPQVTYMLVIDVEQLRGTLLGLHGQDGGFLALGILRDFDQEREHLQVLRPLPDPTGIRKAVFGSLRLEASGRKSGAALLR